MQEQEKNDDYIDLRIVKNIIIERKKTLLKIMGGCVLLAIAFAFLLPKEYESTTLIQMKFTRTTTNFSVIVPPYIELLKSQSVVVPVIEQLDLPAEDKKLMTNKDFAKKYLDINNLKGTNFIEVTAKGKTPEEARQISSGIVESFLKNLPGINEKEQSILVKFLAERLDTAKKEMEEAELALALADEATLDRQTYIGLERQVRISERVYSLILDNYERARIQAVQEVMTKPDFQIVDEASLSPKPSGPKKLLFLSVGVLFGVVINFVYVIVLYQKRL